MRADGPASIVKKLPALKVLNKKEIQLKVGGRRRVLYIATAIARPAPVRRSRLCVLHPSDPLATIGSILAGYPAWLDPSGASRGARHAPEGR